MEEKKSYLCPAAGIHDFDLDEGYVLMTSNTGETYDDQQEYGGF